MKLNFKYAVMAVTTLALGLTSCSNDDGVAKGTGYTAKLNISVTVPETRASVTYPTTVPREAVNNFTAFVVEGNTLCSGYSADGSALTGGTAITASTSSTAIYVIANAGDLSSSITTVSDLTGYIADLNGIGSQTGASGRWATGQTMLTSSDFVQNGRDYTVSKSIILTFIAARITVTVDNQMEHYGDAGSLTLDHIAILNARGESLLFPTNGTSLIPSSYSPGNARNFYEGLANNNFYYYPTAGNFTMAPSLLSDILAADLSNKIYYYYVFENNATTAATFPTIVTLIGTKEDGTVVYWPVHLAPYESWEAGSSTITSAGITRGNSYDICIRLTGDATNGGNSTDDPTKPIVNELIEISITINPWILVTLDKEL